MHCALIAYIIFEAPAEDRNINTLVDMISGMDVKEDDESYMNAVDYMFKGLEKRKPDCFAVKQYKKYKLASGKTAKSILISCGSRLAPFDIPQLREIMSYDELELDRIGDRKTAVFFTISGVVKMGEPVRSASAMASLVRESKLISRSPLLKRSSLMNMPSLNL